MPWFWPKSVATSGTTKNVLTTRLAITPSVDPALGGGQVLADLQSVLPVAADGTSLEPATTATPILPLVVGPTSWILLVDLAGLRGCELQNDADVDVLYCYAASAPADGTDFGMRLRKGANRFFAPSRDRGYVGKIWGRALGAGTTVRRLTW